MKRWLTEAVTKYWLTALAVLEIALTAAALALLWWMGGG